MEVTMQSFMAFGFPFTVDGEAVFEANYFFKKMEELAMVGSLAFLNYPAQLLFKSTKVLPVMIMGAFIPGLRRKYPPHK
ncbi:hypothetical protein Q3G72_016876 [Acer saccharum]|nr:hypothetical protein Q3G72_016876 [Acer saccharum]